MNMTRYALAATAALFVSASGAAMAADYQTLINLPAGSVIDFTVERARSTQNDGGAQGAGLTVTSRYRMTVDPTQAGYRVGVTFQDVSLQPPAPDEIRAQFAEGMAVLSGVVFESDADLSPKSIENWDATLNKLVDNAARTNGDDPAGPAATAARQAYARMEPAVAARSILQDWVLPASAQNVPLDLNKPNEIEMGFSFMAGLPPIRSTYTIELVSLDQAAGVAKISTREQLDPNSAAAGVKAMMDATLVQLPPDAPRPTPEDIARMKFERTTTCSYDMDIATGLAKRTDCTATVTMPDDVATHIDHWVITQTLARR